MNIEIPPLGNHPKVLIPVIAVKEPCDNCASNDDLKYWYSFTAGLTGVLCLKCIKDRLKHLQATQPIHNVTKKVK